MHSIKSLVLELVEGFLCPFFPSSPWLCAYLSLADHEDLVPASRSVDSLIVLLDDIMRELFEEKPCDVQYNHETGRDFEWSVMDEETIISWLFYCQLCFFVAHKRQADHCAHGKEQTEHESRAWFLSSFFFLPFHPFLYLLLFGSKWT